MQDSASGGEIMGSYTSPIGCRDFQAGTANNIAIPPNERLSDRIQHSDQPAAISSYESTSSDRLERTQHGDGLQLAIAATQRDLEIISGQRHGATPNSQELLQDSFSRPNHQSRQLILPPGQASTPYPVAGTSQEKPAGPSKQPVEPQVGQRTQYSDQYSDVASHDHAGIPQSQVGYIQSNGGLLAPITSNWHELPSVGQLYNHARSNTQEVEFPIQQNAIPPDATISSQSNGRISRGFNQAGPSKQTLELHMPQQRQYLGEHYNRTPLYANAPRVPQVRQQYGDFTNETSRLPAGATTERGSNMISAPSKIHEPRPTFPTEIPFLRTNHAERSLPYATPPIRPSSSERFNLATQILVRDFYTRFDALDDNLTSSIKRYRDDITAVREDVDALRQKLTHPMPNKSNRRGKSPEVKDARMTHEFRPHFLVRLSLV